MDTTVAKNTYKKDYQISYADIDHKMALKPSSLFNYLQDLASSHAEMLGFGYSAIYPKNMVWFLLKYRMEFDEYPTGLYNLQIETEPRGYNRLFAHRDFKIINGDRVIGRIASTWAIVDLETRGLVSCETLNNSGMINFQKRETDLSYNKIPVIETADLSKTFEIRYDDIDINGHVNNANYIIWALEPLDLASRSSHKIKTLDMVYKKDIKYGDDVVSKILFKDENTTIHVIRNASTSEDLCQIQIFWE